MVQRDGRNAGPKTVRAVEGRKPEHGKGGGRPKESAPQPAGLTVKTRGRAPLRVAHKNTAPPDTPSSSNSQQSASLYAGDQATDGEDARGVWPANGTSGGEANGHERSNGSTHAPSREHPGVCPGRHGSTGSIPSLGPNHLIGRAKYELGGLSSPRNGMNIAALSASGSGNLGQRTPIRSMGQADPVRQPNTRPVAAVRQVPQTVPVQDGAHKDRGTPRGARRKQGKGGSKHPSSPKHAPAAQQENLKAAPGRRGHDGEPMGAMSPRLSRTAPASKSAPAPATEGAPGAPLRHVQATGDVPGCKSTHQVPSASTPARHAQQRALEGNGHAGNHRMSPLQHRSAPVGGSQRIEQTLGQPLGPKVISEPSNRNCHCNPASELNGLHTEGDRDGGSDFPSRVRELQEFDRTEAQYGDQQGGPTLRVNDSEALSPMSGPGANRNSSLSPTGTTASDPSVPGEEPRKKASRRRNRKKSSKKGQAIPSGVPGADFVDTPPLPPTAFSQGLRPGRGPRSPSPGPGGGIHHADVGPRRVAPCEAQQHDIAALDTSYMRVWPAASAPAGLWDIGNDMATSATGAVDTAGKVPPAGPEGSQQAQAAHVPGLAQEESEPEEGVMSGKAQSRQVKDALKALCSDKLPGSGIRFYERGITNLGNTCYFGSALQLLLGSRQFCWLLKQLSIVAHCLNPRVLPTLVGLGELGKGLTERKVQGGQQAGTQQGSHGWASGRPVKPVMPTMLSTVVNRFQQRHAQSTIGALAEEHDAQEFLLYLLEQIELELLKLKEAIVDGGVRPGSPTAGQSQEDEDDWEVAGRRGKSSTKRTSGSQAESTMSAIFGGSVQSEVKASRMKPSIVGHRFTALDLDIAPQQVNSIEDALQLFTEPDHLTDYRPTDESKPQTATKANRLRDLPQVLIVSLKRYSYTAQGLQKIHKRIGFGSMLTIQRQWVADDRPARGDYRLVATCSHHGRGHGGDHYTANVLQPFGMWLNFNDSIINHMIWRDVANDAPYMLLYEKISK